MNSNKTPDQVFEKLIQDIITGGSTGIVCGSFRQAKLFLRTLSVYLPQDVKTERRTDEYTISGSGWKLSAVPLTNKICGIRFNNLIHDAMIPQDKWMEIIVPMINVKTTGMQGWTLDISEKLKEYDIAINAYYDRLETQSIVIKDEIDSSLIVFGYTKTDGLDNKLVHAAVRVDNSCPII